MENCGRDCGCSDVGFRREFGRGQGGVLCGGEPAAKLKQGIDFDGKGVLCRGGWELTRLTKAGWAAEFRAKGSGGVGGFWRCRVEAKIDYVRTGRKFT